MVSVELAFKHFDILDMDWIGAVPHRLMCSWFGKQLVALS